MRGRSHLLHLGRPKNRPKAWYERGSGVARLAHDQAIVAEAYPTLKYRIDSDAGEVYLEGVLEYRSDCGVPDEVEVRVRFPFNYPEREPRVYDIAGRFPHILDRHFFKDSYSDGGCCLWLPPKSRWSATEPNALRRFLDETVLFFERQLIYDVTEQWPGGEYSHGHYGYMEWVLEMLDGDEKMVTTFGPLLINSSKVERNHSCPCASGRKYKKCHLAVIEEIRRKIEVQTLRMLFR